MSAFKIPTRPIRPKGEQRQPRKESHDHLDFIRQLPCVVCGRPNETQAAHVRFASTQHGKHYTGAGRKPDDRWTVPLCGCCHLTGPEAQHKSNEFAWWCLQGIDPLVIAALLYSHSCAGDAEAAEAVCIHARTL
jgi:hypothetical protein